MTELLVAALLAAAIAGVVTSSAVPLVSRVALAFRAVDLPDGRRRHTGAVPRLGGVAIALGLACGAGGAALVKWGEWGGRVARADLVVFIIATGIVFLVGLADDLVGLSVGKKFAAEFLAALLIVMIGWKFVGITMPGSEQSLRLGVLGGAITLVWIVGVTNAINLADGLDGLAGGVVAIIACSMVVYSVMQQNLFTVLLMAGVAGACLGFLRHNWRGTIFLGDAGSLSLGFVLAVMTVHSSLKAHAAIAMTVPILALGVPVMDTLLVMAARFVEGREHPVADRFLAMFRADRNHLHYLLESWAGRRERVVRWIYAMVALFCAAALVIALTRNVLAATVVVAVELLAVALVRRLGMTARVRQLSESRRAELREMLAAGPQPAETRRDRILL